MDIDSNNIPFLLSSTASYIVIRVFVQPNAKQTQLDGIYGDALRIRVVARPVDNKANQAILEYLCMYFGIKKRHIALLHGEHSRKKHIALYGDVATLLKQCLAIL